jgi:hypothetical protein
MPSRQFSTLFVAAAFWVAVSPIAAAQATLSPAVNHESGVVKEVLSAQDAGYRYCSYFVQWRESTAFLGCVSPPLQRGDTVDFVVYREMRNGHRTLRFASRQDNSGADTERESEESQASIAAGKAAIQQVLTAESDGYRSVAYEVLWHNAQVIVTDSSGAPARSVGDTINFKVIRTETNHELSFSLDE